MRKESNLRFTDAECTDLALEESMQNAPIKADKAQAKIPKNVVRTKEHVADLATGKVTAHLKFEQIDSKKPPSKLDHAIRGVTGSAILSQVHREIRQSEDDNAGLEAARKTQGIAKFSAHTVQSAHHSHKLKLYRSAASAEKRLEWTNIDYLQQKDARYNPQLSSNLLSRWRQKQVIKRQYAAKKAGRSTFAAQKTTECAGKAARKAAEQAKKAAEFTVHHKKGALLVGILFLLTVFLMNTVLSFTSLFQTGLQSVTATTYPSTDEAMLGAETAYTEMESELQNEVDTYETLHSGYDDYLYDLDEIGHDPYVLISLLTAWHGGEWTLDEVQDTLSLLFEKQYQLTQTVEAEVRYRMETVVQTDTGGISHAVTREVPYDYYICTVTLHNENLSHLPMFIMSEEKVGMYAVYISTLGNRPDLFTGYPNASTPQEYSDYDVPKEYLSDKTFAAIITEAEKYLGYPYVWGGCNPTTSFDCSGFVSWVLTNSGVLNTGRLGAQSLYDICTHVSAANAKPGDLIFFEHTYDTDGVSHVGIYAGDGMMIHCGDPISYTSIETTYWQRHFYAFGRLPIA